MLETKIFDQLTTSTRVTDYAGRRVYPVILPQSPTYPCISYQRIWGGQENLLSGYATLQNALIQIDCWATSYAAVKHLSTAVHYMMDVAGSTRFKAVLSGDQDMYEDEVEIFRVSMDFQVWNRE